MKAWHHFVALAVVGSSFACSAASQDLGDNGGKLGAGGPPSTSAPTPGNGAIDLPSVDGGSLPATGPGAGGPPGSGSGSGALVLFGGDDGSSKLDDTWIFDGASWSPLNVTSPPPPRSYASMSTLGAKVVLFGGDQTSADLPYLSDTWTFDGKAWTQQTTPDMTPRGMGIAGTANNQVVLFGGREQKPFDGIDKNAADTWTFGGAGWSQVTGSAPSARYFGSAASVSGKVVLFGGASDSGVSDDTWTFDGSTWRQVQISSPPPARYAASMAALGNEIVLFGGRIAGPSGSFNPTSFDDTWMFDGKTWRQIALANHPPARAGATMGSRGNQVVLFGGSKDLGSSAPMSDTWTFDGTSWTLVTGVSPPSGRNGASFASMP